MNWESTLAPYKQVVEELKVKLKGMRSQYEKESSHSPIEFVTARVKPVPSIIEKAQSRGIAIENVEREMQDIAGVRVVCQFVDDIYTIVDMLQHRNDFEIVEEKDYVSHKKDSGYRSYHMIIKYPVETIHGEMIVLAEIQIRTLAMNFWATNEHSLNYKYDGKLPSKVRLRLQKAAEAAFKLDEEMSKIRSEIHEAQRVFHRK
ncbi:MULTISPECIES: GTP pyrophosphokinase family protein [Oceanobacillus]|uniref:GTP pyrophosphokinase n=1 Tax=Oceanobacillus kimchii TaxID=746691 RepID=A0ABQ5TJ51_9BACI|nr:MULTISPECIES: GTP pyrophosphokinase family protein [Oceanobacillus]MBT2599021.1 GTP pyrophosphokinase family protein [Oceanobacillus sp. ISL-74]MBT2651939.1 GTP pyrophosphokinase family protein [Oceanobacillus sp. ISL-73]MCT1578724.1 GTP pyrophosphokinase family protein [Oceanobacillus kimchii]MCT2136227.1 GTP pyrophosphokinase family protein [Oceanobacillus kimchii]OEH54358.1 GTP pyrophosphokinase [Oceanobacillus sp. E9]